MSRIGIAGQSGAFCTHLYALARKRNLGIPVCVTTGNEVDIDVADTIAWLAQDPDTDVIAAYAEGFGDGERLIAALESARQARKPVVFMKVGRSEVGKAAVQSHTGAIAGNDAVLDAVFGDFGVVRARTADEMLDIAYAATRKIYPVGNSLGVVTISGGFGILVSDAAEELGLAMPQMSAKTQARLKERAPFASPLNPVDCTAQAINDPSLVRDLCGAMVEEGYKSILGFFSTGGGPLLGGQIRKFLAEVKTRHPDRLYAVSIVASERENAAYEEGGFLVFEDPSRAVVAIEAMGRFGEAFARPPAAPAQPVTLRLLPSGAMNEAEAKRLLGEAGVAIAPEIVCATADEAVEAAARLGFPVVLKVLSADILHKSDIGGVRLNLRDEASVRAAHGDVIAAARSAKPDARIEGTLVAKQLQGGTECIMGIVRDPIFGPAAMFGLGGIFVEVIKDVVFKRCPFDVDAAKEMIGKIRGAPLLQGARGREPADIDALATLLSRLSVFAVEAGPRLLSVDLNPVFAMPRGKGAFAVDAVVELSPSEREAPTSPATPKHGAL